jgi:hypothetical protein
LDITWCDYSENQLSTKSSYSIEKTNTELVQNEDNHPHGLEYLELSKWLDI